MNTKLDYYETGQIGLSINNSSPCACSALQKGKMSLEQFENLISHYRDIEVISPNSPNKWGKFTKNSQEIADFIVNSFFVGLLEICPFYDDQDEMENLLNNNGTLQLGNKVYKLILLCKKDADENELPIGGILLQSKVKKDGMRNAALRIVALRVVQEHQKKYLSTLMLAYAVKVAHQENRSEIKLDSSEEGVIPYLRFGFGHYNIAASDWKKLTQEMREEMAIQNPLLCLVLDLQESKVAMKEQLYRALFPHFLIKE